MQTRWTEAGVSHAVVAPVSLVVSAFAPVDDVRRTLTPQLCADADTSLLLIDLGGGRNRLGASVLAQAFMRSGGRVPDLDEPARIAALFAGVQALRARDLLLACHDRSDGGLFVTLCEMAFAGKTGLDIKLPANAADGVLAFGVPSRRGVVGRCVGWTAA